MPAGWVQGYGRAGGWRGRGDDGWDRWAKRPRFGGRGKGRWDGGKGWEDPEQLAAALHATLQEAITIRQGNAALKAQQTANEAKMMEALGALQADTNRLRSSLHELQSLLFTTQTVRKVSLRRYDAAYPALQAEAAAIQSSANAEAMRTADWGPQRAGMEAAAAAFCTTAKSLSVDAGTRLEKSHHDALREMRITAQVTHQELDDCMRQLARERTAKLRHDIAERMKATSHTPEQAAGVQRNVARVQREFLAREAAHVAAARGQLDALQAEAISEATREVGDWADLLVAEKQQSLRPEIDTTKAEFARLNGIEAKAQSLRPVAAFGADIEDTRLVIGRLHRLLETPGDVASAERLAADVVQTLEETKATGDKLLKEFSEALGEAEGSAQADRTAWWTRTAAEHAATKKTITERADEWAAQYAVSVREDGHAAVRGWADGVAAELVAEVMKAQEECLRFRAAWMEDFRHELRSFGSDVTRANRLWGAQFMSEVEGAIDARLAPARRPWG